MPINWICPSKKVPKVTILIKRTIPAPLFFQQLDHIPPYSRQTKYSSIIVLSALTSMILIRCALPFSSTVSRQVLKLEELSSPFSRGSSRTWLLFCWRVSSSSECRLPLSSRLQISVRTWRRPWSEDTLKSFFLWPPTADLVPGISSFNPCCATFNSSSQIFSARQSNRTWCASVSSALESRCVVYSYHF